MSVIEEVETKKSKPIAFGYKGNLYVILVGELSFVYEVASNQKFDFPILSYHVANTNDLKALVLNEKDLFIFQSSKWSSKSKN
jgi:hypothetical protein